jgi:ribosomal protein L12E/L44/L45/RPP1/RPP2
MADTTEEEHRANMHIVSKRLGSMTVNVLVNSRAVAANERLRVYKAPVTKQSLGNVISAIASTGSDVAEGSAAPKAKGKSKAASKASGKAAAKSGDKRKR